VRLSHEPSVGSPPTAPHASRAPGVCCITWRRQPQLRSTRLRARARRSRRSSS
jgi:hypothetical protein